MDYFSINFDDLIFIDDFESKTITDVTLVDHCELDEQEKSNGFSDIITCVIDHHMDKKFFLNANPRIIDTTAGSNATLVTDLIRSNNFQLNESFSSMLIFPILFDTNKLTNRASQKDHDMVKYLIELCNLNCDSIYARLDEIRFSDGADEDTNIILSKDYKKYTAINDIKWAMSSVTIEVKNWLEAEEKINEIKAFMSEKDLQFFGILSIFKKQNGEFGRDLGLFTTNSNFLYELNENRLIPNLNVNKIVQKSFAYSIYGVSQIHLTRKYWQPFLENFLKNLLNLHNKINKILSPTILNKI